jgi:hypothetical protein
MKKLVGNLPLVVSAAIMVAFSVDAPLTRALKTEATFGLWVAVLVPAAVVLLVVQILLWVRWPWIRPIGRAR